MDAIWICAQKLGKIWRDALHHGIKWADDSELVKLGVFGKQIENEQSVICIIVSPGNQLLETVLDHHSVEVGLWRVSS